MTTTSIARLWRFVGELRTNALYSALVIAFALLCTCFASAQSIANRGEAGYSSSSLFAPAPLPAFQSAVRSAGSALPVSLRAASPAIPAPSGGAGTAQSVGAPSFRKWGFAFGGGVNIPSGGQSGTYHTKSMGLQFGLARNLNRYFGAQAEYDWDFLGIPDSVLANYCSNCTSADAIINALTVNPILNVHSSGRIGLYAIGGGGYYWKKSRFLTWTGAELCTPTEGCIPVQSVVSSWSSNAFGYNFGGGMTWRLGSSQAKVFAEGRYTWINNQTPSSGGGEYPPAYYRTTFIPTVAGIRW